MSRRSTSVAALLRVALMALFALSAITFAPGTAAAAGTKTFTSDAYSFSVSWDSSSWTSKLGTGGSDGSVTLAAGASSIVINGFDGSSNDLNGCVSQLASKRKSSQDVSSFKQLTSGHVTVTAADGSTHRLYGFNVKNVAKVAYFECRPGAGNQFVSVSFETNDKGYDSALSLFDDVYQSITVGETTAADTSSSGPSSGPTGKIGSATKTPTPEDPTATATKVAKPKATATIAPSKTTKSAPVLKGNVYTGTNKGYTVTFDDAVWNDVKVIEPDGTGYDGLDINSDDTLGSIEAIPTSLSLKDCLSESINAMGKTDGFSNVVEAPDLEKPATVKGTVNAMVTFVVTTDTGTVDITRYIECRTLVKGASLLRIELAAGTVRATDVLPTWTALLAGIKVASVSGGTKATATATPRAKTTPKATVTPTSKKTPKATATTSAGAFPNVNGRTFTSPAFGFTFTWPSKFTPLLASGDESGDVIAVGDGTSSVLIFSKSTADGTTVQSCLDDKETTLKTSDTSTNVAVATDSANKEVRGKTSTGVYVLYAYTTDKGADMYEYMRCDTDSKGTFILDLTFFTPASAFTTSVDDIQAVLDGILLP